ncbi:MAG: metallophosphoesterase, partial [Cyclobacteriaceae bacterium]|nr:metallophosphoesterase [Cyclobacteriaceae bacterium]
MHTNQLIVFLIVITVYFLIEIYVFGVVRALLAESSDGVRRSAWIIYWGISLIALIGVLFYTKLDPVVFRELRLFILTLFFVNLMAKLAASLLVAGDDFRRLVTFLYGYFSPATPQTMPGRSAFMAKAAMAAGAVPLAVFSFGILTGAYDYRVRRKSITFPNLPRAFDGIRVVQISDIHTGSFFNKTAVQGGIDLINGEKPDLVLFTGDLVNDESAEAKPYLDIFKKIKSP